MKNAGQEVQGPFQIGWKPFIQEGSESSEDSERKRAVPEHISREIFLHKYLPNWNWWLHLPPIQQGHPQGTLEHPLRASDGLSLGEEPPDRPGQSGAPSERDQTERYWNTPGNID